METKDQKIIEQLQETVNLKRKKSINQLQEEIDLQKKVLDHLQTISDPHEMQKDIQRIRKINALMNAIMIAYAITEHAEDSLKEKQRNLQAENNNQLDHSDNE